MFRLAAAVPLLADAPVPGSRVVLFGCYLTLVGAMFLGARKGYWRGPLRQLAPTLALFAAAVGAWLGGAPFGHAVLKTTLVPWLLRGICGMVLLGAIVFLLAFAILWRLGRSRLTNQLGETDNPVLGAIVGCWTALLWGAAGFAVLCAIASVGEFWLLKSPVGDSAGGGLARAAVGHLSRVKNSLALARGLGWLNHWSPLPDKTRDTLEKATRVLATPAATRQFSRIESIRAIASHPAFYPLRNDPEIHRLAVEERNIEALLAHPLVLRMLADEDFQTLLASIDLDALLDSALAAAAGTASTVNASGDGDGDDATTAPPAAVSAPLPSN